MDVTAPIGVFDSGIGGLTVVEALHQLMPNERIVYFGDTAHLPYGDKSAESLQAYVRQISGFLCGQGVKALVVACNTASAAAFHVAQAVGATHGIPVFEAISPAVEAAVQASPGQRIGVIGTQTTVNTHIYLGQILRKLPRAFVVEKATPLLVPMIEEGWLNNPLSAAVIEAYMSDTSFQHIDTLILGCTHYPLVQAEVEAYFARTARLPVVVVSSSASTARHVANALREKGLDSETPKRLPDQYFVSDLTPGFQRQAELFFGPGIQLSKLRLGESCAGLPGS